jgi:hypothetical protein
MSTLSTNVPIPYCDAQDLVKQLNLQQSATDPNKYIVYAIPTSVDILNTFVKQANEQTTALWGDLTKSNNYSLARQYAIWRAVLNMIETMTINWVIAGIPVTVGDISINRLGAMQAATVELKENANRELARLYIMLSEMDFPSNYQSPSPYVDTGGQAWYS